MGKDCFAGLLCELQNFQIGGIEMPGFDYMSGSMANTPDERSKRRRQVFI